VVFSPRTLLSQFDFSAWPAFSDGARVLVLLTEDARIAEAYRKFVNRK